jgi:hypothetical protein
MMKKLLVLMLVLGMTSMANAVLQISVNGDKNPTDSEYTINQGGELILGVWTDATITGSYYGNTNECDGWALVAEVAGASILCWGSGYVKPQMVCQAARVPSFERAAASDGARIAKQAMALFDPVCVAELTRKAIGL